MIKKHEKKLTKNNDILRHYAKAEDVKICRKCGEMIVGEYDFVQTKRGTKLYFHKGMKLCGRKTGWIKN